MKSSSSDARPASTGPGHSTLATPDLRVARWTRFGSESVLGDTVTEELLDGLAARAQRAARSQGYSVGWAEGRRAAAAAAAVQDAERSARWSADEERREREHQAAVRALGMAAEQIRGLLGELASDVERQASALACRLTEELVGLSVVSVGASDVVARILQVLPEVPLGRVRVHPSVATSAAVQDLATRGLDVIADPAMGRADALVETPDGSVTDLRLDEAMARVRGVLS